MILHSHQEISQKLKQDTFMFQILKWTNVIFCEIPFRRVQLLCGHEATWKFLCLFIQRKLRFSLFFLCLRPINTPYPDVAKYKICKNWLSKNSILCRQFFLIHDVIVFFWRLNYYFVIAKNTYYCKKHKIKLY